MVISLDVEKTFDKIQYPFVNMVLERAGIQVPHLNIIKATYSKLTANIKFNGEKVKLIPLKSGPREGHPFFVYLFNKVLKVLGRAKDIPKEIKGILI